MKAIYVLQKQVFYINNEGNEVGCGVGEDDIQVMYHFKDAKKLTEEKCGKICEKYGVDFCGKIRQPERTYTNQDLGGLRVEYNINKTKYASVFHVYRKVLF